MKLSKPISDFLDTLDYDQVEFFEERAAILEYDGGYSRDVAELEAIIQTKKFFNI